MASSNLTQALLLGGMGGGGMMSPMGLGMYDPAALGAMQRLGLGQSMVQEGMSSSPAYPAQALSRLGQSLIGALMMRNGFSDLSNLSQSQAAVLPAVKGYIQGDALPPTTAPTPAAATPSPTAGAPQQTTAAYPTQIASMESGGKSDATNPLFPPDRGGPLGPQQFTAATWGDFAKANPQTFLGMSPDQVMAARSDPAISAQATQWLASRNAPVLQGAGIQPTAANLGVAHALGGTGAAGVLALPDTTPMADALKQTQPAAAGAILAENPQYQKMTVGDLKAKYAGLDTSGMAANAANSGQPSPTPGGIQTGMQNPQVQHLMGIIQRATELKAAHPFPLDPIGREADAQLELANKQLNIGIWQTDPTNPNRVVNIVNGEPKLLVTGTGRFATGPNLETLYAPPAGGEPKVIAPNPSGFKPGSPEQAIAALGLKVQAGTATPQEVASYNTAAALFQKREVTMNPSTQQPISVPTQPLPVGAPQPGGPPGSNASPAGGTPQQGSSTGVIPLTPGGAPTPAVAERYTNLDKLHQSYNAAQDDLQQAALLKDQLHQIGTSGPATEVLSKLSQYAAQAGVSPETLTQFSLPSGASEATASALANGLAMELAKMRFPGQRISNMDLKTAQSTKPNPNQPLAAADFLIDNTIVPQAQRDIDRYGSVVHLTDPQHPDFDPSLGSLNARLYDFDQANPVSKYTPRLQQQQSPQVAGAPNAAAPPTPAPGASQADIEAEMRRRGLLK